MSDEMTWPDVVNWLADREGKQVYVEVGMNDPTLDANDYICIAQHVTLGKAGIGEDQSHERGLFYLPFNEEPDPQEPKSRNRLYIDKTRITDIKWSGFGGKLYFHGGPMYLAITGS